MREGPQLKVLLQNQNSARSSHQSPVTSHQSLPPPTPPPAPQSPAPPSTPATQSPPAESPAAPRDPPLSQNPQSLFPPAPSASAAIRCTPTANPALQFPAASSSHPPQIPQSPSGPAHNCLFLPHTPPSARPASFPKASS